MKEEKKNIKSYLNHGRVIWRIEKKWKWFCVVAVRKWNMNFFHFTPSLFFAIPYMNIWKIFFIFLSTFELLSTLCIVSWSISLIIIIIYTINDLHGCFIYLFFFFFKNVIVWVYGFVRLYNILSFFLSLFLSLDENW
jgi:hypothetical protein